MKKFEIISENFDLREDVIAGDCQPYGTILTKNLFQDGCLDLQAEDELGAPEKGYILVWNKRLAKGVAIQEVDILDGNVILAYLTSNFLSDLKNAASFKYGRICLALQWKNEYAIAYLKSSDQREGFIGYFQGAAFYYSEANVLSVKCMDQSEYYKEVVQVTITEIKVSDLQMHFSAVIHALSPEDVSWQLISKTNGIPLGDIELSVSWEKGPNQAQGVMISLDFSNITKDDYNLYNLSAFYGEYELKVALSQDFEEDTALWAQTYSSGRETSCELCFCKSEDGKLNVQIAEKIYPYMFTIVTAVYNTELFLSEAIESILTQDVRKLEPYIVGKGGKGYMNCVYRDICEIILVDDGSTDISGQICDEYAAAHENIKVIHKENGGVSSARNIGISMASGKYINFMDSDDKFSNNVLATTFLFFEQHYEEIDIVTIPLVFFGARKGEHVLNGKFAKGTRVVDLWIDYDISVFSTCSSIFKTDVIKNKIYFDEQLSIGEDVKLIYNIFIDGKARLGVINSCTYWYRKRGSEGSSALDSSIENIDYYTSFISKCLFWIMSMAEKRYNFIPRYIQFAIGYQIQWRYKGDGDGSIAKRILGNDGFDKYKAQLTDLLQNIDIDIILQQRNIWIEQKMYMLSCKLGKKNDCFFDGSDILYFQEGRLLFRESKAYIRLDFLKINNSKLYIEGVNRSFNKDAILFVRVNNEFIETTRLFNHKSVYSMGEPIFYSTTFQFNFILDDSVLDYQIEFYENIDGNYIPKRELRFHKTMPLTQTYKKSYYIKDAWCVTRKPAGIMIKNITPISEKLNILSKYETPFLKELESKCKNKNAIEFRKKIRSIISDYRQGPHKKIWLLSDRVNTAGDNGEALFLYLMEKQDTDVEVYFVINKDSPDYVRMKKIGKVIAQGSTEHRILHLLADCIISSQADDYVIDPFYYENTSELYKDFLSNKKFVFLQHGIIKDDLSGWLNRYNKDLSGFVTSAKPEWQSILDYDYYYSENEVWLTGLPRYDRLYHNEKNYITIMPTWRKYLNKPNALGNQINGIVDSFDKSEFYEFYNTLLNDKKLIAAAKKYEYRIAFMPHPNLIQSLDKFDRNPEVIFWGQEKSYREVFAESKLVITDYSSTSMDFAYLRKPVVYCQFDKETFFANHSYTEGYFNYERDGFGEVTYDLDNLINIIIDYMKNGCKLKQIYKDRMNKFFAFDDKNNCERVYQKLKKL